LAPFTASSGTTIGGSILVIPALLGAGLAGMALLATDALIGLSTLVVKAAGFGGFDVLTPRLLLIGACMIPGTSFARSLILRTPLDVHVMAMEVIVVSAPVRLCGTHSPAIRGAALPGAAPQVALRRAGA
jgi:hypothetical protein